MLFRVHPNRWPEEMSAAKQYLFDNAKAVLIPLPGIQRNEASYVVQYVATGRITWVPVEKMEAPNDAKHTYGY